MSESGKDVIDDALMAQFMDEIKEVEEEAANQEAVSSNEPNEEQGEQLQVEQLRCEEDVQLLQCATVEEQLVTNQASEENEAETEEQAAEEGGWYSEEEMYEDEMGEAGAQLSEVDLSSSRLAPRYPPTSALFPHRGH